MHIHIPHISTRPELKKDRELEEILQGERCCQNFIDQDLTFLQPSLIHAPKQDTSESLIEEHIKDQSLAEAVQNSLTSP